MATNFQGALTSGADIGFNRNSGFNIISKTVPLQAVVAATVDTMVYLPDGCQIVDIILDTTVLHTSASAAVTIGTAAYAGTEICPSTSVLSQGRVRPTLTTQLNNMLALVRDSGQSDKGLFVRMALGTPTAVGTTQLTILYAPKL